jgi:hypothetical protein
VAAVLSEFHLYQNKVQISSTSRKVFNETPFVHRVSNNCPIESKEERICLKTCVEMVREGEKVGVGDVI